MSGANWASGHQQPPCWLFNSMHYGDVKWPPWRLKIPANRVFAQQFVQTENKNSKGPRYCPFVRRNHFDRLFPTEALKGHRVVWKIEIYYLIRMTYEWKSMSSGWHNNIVVTHLDEIPISAKSSGWHMVVWYVIRMTYCSVQKSSGWDTARN